MPLPTEGEITIFDIAAEFPEAAGPLPHSIQEFYGVTPTVPESGEITVFDFYGAAKPIPPICNPDFFSTNANVPLSGNVFANDDPVVPPFIAAEIVFQPLNGNVTLDDAGDFVYTPNADYEGLDVWQYRGVNSDQGASDTAGVFIFVLSPVPDPPIANPDSFSGFANEQITGNVTANDETGPTGEPFTVTDYTQPTGDGFVGGPAGGGVVVTPEGDMTFTPDVDWFGVATFFYTITNTLGGQAATTVTLTVEAQDPTATDDTFATNFDTPVSGNVLENDTPNFGTTLTAAKTTDPTSGTAEVEPDGSMTYTPNEGFSGADSFTYTCTNAGDKSATATVNITVRAELTASIEADSTTVIEGQTATFTCTPAGGDGVYTYQWYKNYVAVEGATAVTYEYVAVLAENGASFTCVVADTASNPPATSNAVVLTIQTSLDASASADPPAVVAPNNVTFTCVPTGGSGTYTYQWRRAGADISGATGQTYVKASSKTDIGVSYDCVVNDGFGQAVSNPVTISVTQPTLLNVTTGDDITNSLNTNGNRPPQRYVNDPLWYIETDNAGIYNQVFGSGTPGDVFTYVNTFTPIVGPCVVTVTWWCSDNSSSDFPSMQIVQTDANGNFIRNYIQDTTRGGGVVSFAIPAGEHPGIAMSNSGPNYNWIGVREVKVVGDY